MATADHPDDVWVDTTALGDQTPRRLLAVDGREIEIEKAKTLYVADRLTAAELEQHIEKALT